MDKGLSIEKEVNTPPMSQHMKRHAPDKNIGNSRCTTIQNQLHWSYNYNIHRKLMLDGHQHQQGYYVTHKL